MQKFLNSEEIVVPAGGEDTGKRLPSRRVFAARAERLHQLAKGHAMEDFLAFAARLADAQQNVLDRHGHAFQEKSRPDADHLARCRQHSIPPLDAQGGPVPAEWVDVLHALATEVVPHSPAGLQNAIAELPDFPAERLHALARAILRAEEDLGNPVELALAPLIGASLQVLWTARALALQPGDIPAGFEGSLCPTCGSQPVASILRIDPAGQGVRYATCSLCACEWQVTRNKCVPCRNTCDIAYLSPTGEAATLCPAVEAETCPACHRSLKIASMETDPLVDAFADDLATLALDMQADQAGFHRAGRNLFLFAP